MYSRVVKKGYASCIDCPLNKLMEHSSVYINCEQHRMDSVYKVMTQFKPALSYRSVVKGHSLHSTTW